MAIYETSNHFTLGDFAPEVGSTDWSDAETARLDHEQALREAEEQETRDEGPDPYDLEEARLRREGEISSAADNAYQESLAAQEAAYHAQLQKELEAERALHTAPDNVVALSDRDDANAVVTKEQLEETRRIGLHSLLGFAKSADGSSFYVDKMGVNLALEEERTAGEKLRDWAGNLARAFLGRGAGSVDVYSYIAMRAIQADIENGTRSSNRPDETAGYAVTSEVGYGVVNSRMQIPSGDGILIFPHERAQAAALLTIGAAAFERTGSPREAIKSIKSQAEQWGIETRPSPDYQY